MKYTSTSPFHLKQLLCATTILGTASFSHAADSTWDGSADANWHNTANWDTGIIPGGTNGPTADRAIFDGVGSQNAVTFGVIVGSGTNSVGGSAGFGGILVTENQTSALSINSSAAASRNFRLAANTGITIESGAGAFSMGTSGTVFQLVFQGTSTTHTFQNDSANLATLGDKITLLHGGSQSTNVSFTGSGDWDVKAAIAGTGTGVAITKSGAGTLTLSGANTYDGSTTINAGVLEATTLANSGVTSSIGDGTAAPTHLVFGSSTATLRHIGSTDVSTNRGFTLSSGDGGGATIESSGTGGSLTIAVSGLGTIDYGTANETRVLTLGGTNTGENTFVKVLGNNGTGATSLTKAGEGKWVLSGANTYSGGTTVNNGTLTAGHASAFGSGKVTLAAGSLKTGAFTVANDVDITGNAAISGTYSGNVDTGNNASRTINTTDGVSINNLTGQGVFSGGLVTIVGSHTPGNSPGTQTFESGLAYGDGASLTLEIAADGLTFDFINVTSGGLTIGENVALTLSLFGAADYSDAFWDSNRSYTLISTDSVTGNFTTTNNLGGAGEGSWTYGWEGNDYKATWTAVPEPTTALLGSIGVLFLLRRRRA